MLPPKPKIEIPQGEHVDEVSMVDFESTKGGSSSRGAEGAGFGYGEGYSDDEEEEMGGGQRVECNTH